ncbi:uncharacterized protein ZK673.1-like [Haliotis cracherodii]|uniref:uncharacterized protein ZK673.1-like n=1 Tax=Haliotis cracherodii TaxID=6455 RepID=UPI0039E8B358
MLVLLSMFVFVVTSKATFDPTCVDRLPDCHFYDATSCRGIYEPWAKVNCNNTCGFCQGQPTPAPSCRNKIPTCDDFDHDSTCNDPQYKYWVEEHCRLYCRKCTPEQLYAVDHPTTTSHPQSTLPSCRDLAPDCAASGKSVCTDSSQALRAHITCKKYCGFCSVSGPTL